MGKHAKASRRSRRDTYDACVAAKRQARPTSPYAESNISPRTSPTSTAFPSLNTWPITLSKDDTYLASPSCEAGEADQPLLGRRRDSAIIAESGWKYCSPAQMALMSARGTIPKSATTNKKDDDVVVAECALRRDPQLRRKIIWGACATSLVLMILIGLVLGFFVA